MTTPPARWTALTLASLWSTVAIFLWHKGWLGPAVASATAGLVLAGIGLVGMPRSSWVAFTIRITLALAMSGLLVGFPIPAQISWEWSVLAMAGGMLGVLLSPVFWLVSLATWVGAHLMGLGSGEEMERFQGIPWAVCFLAPLAAGTVLKGLWKALVESRNQLRERQARCGDLELRVEALDKAKKRIARFVKPALIEEAKAGVNPAAFEPIQVERAVMFCDMRDFSRLTEVLNAYETQTFLNQYFSMMTFSIHRQGGEVDRMMGDTVMAVFPGGQEAIAAALDMREELQKFNRKLLDMGHRKIRNGIGIAKGEVMLGNFGSHGWLDRTAIGEAVNLARRMESLAKLFDLEIVVTENVLEDRKDLVEWRWLDTVPVKSASGYLRAFEIFEHQPPEVKRFKLEQRLELNRALEYYHRKRYNKAMAILTDILPKVPPHRYEKGKLMDTVVQHYLQQCRMQLDPALATARPTHEISR